jgi:hypothetical protein
VGGEGLRCRHICRSIMVRWMGIVALQIKSMQHMRSSRRTERSLKRDNLVRFQVRIGVANTPYDYFLAQAHKHVHQAHITTRHATNRRHHPIVQIRKSAFGPSSTPNPTTMRLHLSLLQPRHLPAQQRPQLRTHHSLPLHSDSCRHMIAHCAFPPTRARTSRRCRRSPSWPTIRAGACWRRLR